MRTVRLRCALAARGGFADAVTLLLARKAETGATDRLGSTPVHQAGIKRRNIVVTLRRLMDAGGKIDRGDSHGITPGMVATSRGHLAKLEPLNSGLASQLAEDSRLTPLLIAAARDNKDEFSRLVSPDAMKQGPPGFDEIFFAGDSQYRGRP